MRRQLDGMATAALHGLIVAKSIERDRFSYDFLCPVAYLISTLCVLANAARKN